jgi:hypothetical protein
MPARMAVSRASSDRVSDAAVKKATGADWAAWIALLDAWGASGKTHPQIAKHLASAHGLSPWWSQRVTNEYERRRMGRPLGRVAGGTYQIGVHRTFAITARQAWSRLVSASGLAIWLQPKGRPRLKEGLKFSLADGAEAEVRRFKAPDMMRLRIRRPGARASEFIQVRIQPRATGHAVSFHEEGLPNARARIRRRRHWTASLEALYDE